MRKEKIIIEGNPEKDNWVKDKMRKSSPPDIFTVYPIPVEECYGVDVGDSQIIKLTNAKKESQN